MRGPLPVDTPISFPQVGGDSALGLPAFLGVFYVVVNTCDPVA